MASRPLDHTFISAMRERIEVATLVDKLQAHIADKDATPLSMTQLKAADILLRKAIPDLKAIEHTEAPRRDLTREELIERLTALHARPAGEFERRPAQANARTVDGTEVSH